MKRKHKCRLMKQTSMERLTMASRKGIYIFIAFTKRSCIIRKYINNKYIYTEYVLYHPIHQCITQISTCRNIILISRDANQGFRITKIRLKRKFIHPSILCFKGISSLNKKPTKRLCQIIKIDTDGK